MYSVVMSFLKLNNSMEQQKDVENINTNFVFLHLKSKTLRRLLTHDGTKIGVYSFPSVQEIQLLCVRCHDTGSMIKQKVGGKKSKPEKIFQNVKKRNLKNTVITCNLIFLHADYLKLETGSWTTRLHHILTVTKRENRKDNIHYV